jgi:hypothetical protein
VTESEAILFISVLLDGSKDSEVEMPFPHKRLVSLLNPGIYEALPIFGSMKIIRTDN